MDRIIKQIADHYGMNQIGQAAEELAELIVALHHYERVYNSGLDASTRQEYMHVAEEIADVEIMMDQIRYILNIPEPLIADWKQYKIGRAFEGLEEVNHGTKSVDGGPEGSPEAENH